MALMNMMSSNVNQWTVLAAMIPIVFSISRGEFAALPFDGAQRDEILLTVLQSVVAVLLLANMRFEWWNAVLLFVLWLVQFLVAEWRQEISYAYAGWNCTRSIRPSPPETRCFASRSAVNVFPVPGGP